MSHADDQHPWLPHLPTRPVRCYRCAEPFDVALKAISASCPHCYTRIDVSDVLIKSTHWGGRIETCGAVTIHRKARAQSTTITAGGPVHILGLFEGALTAGGLVFLGEHATIRGCLRAPAIHIQPGAIIDDARLIIPGNAHDALTGAAPSAAPQAIA